jgi:hypothetical protein
LDLDGLATSRPIHHVRSSSGGTGREDQRVAKIRIGKHEIRLPESRPARLAIGSGLILLGLLGFLPVLGFWMIPAGLLVLSTDIPAVRRFNRRVGVAVKRWWTGKRSAKSGAA